MNILWLRIRTRLQALSQLRTIGQWRLFVRIFLVAALVPVLFRCKLSTVSRWLERPIRGSAAAKDSVDSIVRLVELALRIGRPLLRPKCLTRCITMYYFLRPTGLNLAVCFGAALRNGQLEPVPGHCWLLKDG